MATLVSAAIGFALAVAAIAVVAFLEGSAMKLYTFRPSALQSLRIRIFEQGAGSGLERVERTAEFFAALGKLKIRWGMEFAMYHLGTIPELYLVVPRSASAFVTRHILRVFPGADVRKSEDHPVLNPEGKTAAMFLRQKEAAWLPIPAYGEKSYDIPSALFGFLKTLSAIGEGAAIQIIARTVPARMRATLRDEFTKAQKNSAGQPAAPLETGAVRLADDKLAKHLFLINVRVVASATTQFRAEELIEEIGDIFSRVTLPHRNALRPVKTKQTAPLVHVFTQREFTARESMTLGSDELATLFHF